MEWFLENWVWVLFLAGFIAMHMFGHGGHGDDDDEKPTGKDGKQRTSKQEPRHQH